MDEEPAQPVASNPEIVTRKIHSHIFDGLVTSDDDLIGLVAYGLYQLRKRRWIKSVEAATRHTPEVLCHRKISTLFVEVRYIR